MGDPLIEMDGRADMTKVIVDSGFEPSSVPLPLGLFNSPKRRCKFRIAMLHCMAQDEYFVDKFIVNIEATFQLNNKVNRRNIHTRTVEFPKALLIIYLFCAMSVHRAYAPVMCMKTVVNVTSHLDMQ